ncbi:serine/threonine-protein kinase [Pseudonocardia sp. TRM90224]|uniref:serine/threonine-protein kinase n=1 Tax=Pseudonocardia sp. TRM90224 TaxID=2812678 RepID=UPI001E2886EC|nr:serine/threonine-protein kinase [Pseudonocardia sp. TRM90224]
MNVLAAGQSIADRYQLDRRIAVGGMGEVWEAVDTRLGRSVAVKVLRPELSDDPEFLHRFRIEARTVASLDNPGIAAVHDYGEDEGSSGRATAYLVMELVRGDPLSTLISRGPIDTDETMRIVEDAAWALQAAHERGFVHRDVKPGNILIRTDGVVKLTDFGIAKAADAVPVTRSGMVMGTAHYIAPEQASGGEAGPAGDVYSLGIVGYECLAGHRPFRAESAVAVAMMQVRDEPPPLPTSIPSWAREIIEATLVKDPTLRYATGGEFAAAVAAVRRGEPLPPPGANAGATYTPARARPAITVKKPKPVVEEPEPEPERQQAPPPAPTPTPKPSTRPGPGPGPAPQGPPRQPPPRTPHRANRPQPTGSGRVQPPPSGQVTQVNPGAQRQQRQAPPRTGQGPRQSPPSQAQRQQSSASHSAHRARQISLSTQPLRLRPRSKAPRILLVILFVLLTVAAMILGWFVLRGGLPSIPGITALGVTDQPNRTSLSITEGSLASREDLLVGWAAPQAPGSAGSAWFVR